jgi:mono/diheme cytochrome c family protein
MTSCLRTRFMHTTMTLSAVALVAGVAAHGGRTTAQSAQGAGSVKSVWDRVYNQDQAKRGLAKYTQVCSSCHQSDLSGSDQAPGLAGGEFLDRWDGQSVGDLADRIRTSMPYDDVGSLNTQMSADITAYLLQANNFPDGQEELAADRAAMKAVLIKRK